MALLQNILFCLIQLGALSVIFAALEKIRPAYDIASMKRDYFSELGYYFTNVLFSFPVAGFIVRVTLISYLMEPYFPSQLFKSQIDSLPFGFQILIAAILLDFLVYVRHRFTHFYAWRFHAIHHSAEEITWLTKFRLHPADVLIAATFDAVGLYFLGFNVEAIAQASMIIMLIDLMNHANIRLSFPKPLRYLISCPDYHKWHHALEKEAKNKNFALAFPFFDLLFGSYYFPRVLPPEKCGILYTDDKEPRVPRGFFPQLLHPFKILYSSIFR